MIILLSDYYKTINFMPCFVFVLSGVVNEKGKTYGIYALSVTKKYDSGFRDTWHVYRRYSDFYELHQKVREKVRYLL